MDDRAAIVALGDGQPFAGTHDGEGFAVTGLSIDVASARGVGVFGFVSRAEIRNLTVRASESAGSGRSETAGGVVGVAGVVLSGGAKLETVQSEPEVSVDRHRR